MKRTPKKIIYLSVLFLTIAVGIVAVGRSRIAKLLIRQKLDAWGHVYGVAVNCRDIRMAGWNTFCLEGISAVPGAADTLLQARSLRISIDWKKAMRGKIALKKIEADSLRVCFSKKATSSNFDFLYRKTGPSRLQSEKDKQDSGIKHASSHAEREVTPSGATAPPAPVSYARLADRSLSLLFRLLPPEVVLNRTRVAYQSENDTLILRLSRLDWRDNRFYTEIVSQENQTRSKWICRGKRRDEPREISVSLYAAEGSKITFPFLGYRFGATLRFDTLSFALQAPPLQRDVQPLTGKALVKGLTLHHPRISPDTLLLDRGAVDYHLHIGKAFAALDSSTTVRFNRLDFHPYLEIRKTEADTSWQIAACIDKRNFPADDLFSSLPRGLFTNLDGLKTEGALSYHFRLAVDFARVDSLILESTLQAKNFHILAYGETDLRKMNEPFLYTVYENGEAVRSFEIGPSHPGFRPFAAVSRYLPLAIMQSEDAGFFQHNGFIPSAIRQSLIQDIKERRFARGGSTLSMQLVKNVFLSRRKTIARKLEEILIVWLIEGQRLCTKERMFEVYLNVAEWGPGIYGAAEAAHYYFGKEPADLTLSESIFLASIIPMPKHVRSCFEGLQLKPHYEEYYQLIVGRLVDRGLVTAGEAAGVSPSAVQITGPAKAYLTEGR